MNITKVRGKSNEANAILEKLSEIERIKPIQHHAISNEPLLAIITDIQQEFRQISHTISTKQALLDHDIKLLQPSIAKLASQQKLRHDKLEKIHEGSLAISDLHSHTEDVCIKLNLVIQKIADLQGTLAEDQQLLRSEKMALKFPLLAQYLKSRISY